MEGAVPREGARRWAAVCVLMLATPACNKASDTSTAQEPDAGASCAACGAEAGLAPSDAGSSPAIADAGTTDAGAADAGSGGADGGAGALATLSVSTGALKPAFDPSVLDYELTSLTSLFPLSVTATTTDNDASLSIHGTPATSAVASTFQLAAGETFSVVVQSAGGAPTTYTVHYTPADFPVYTVSTIDASQAGTEPLLMTPASTYLAMIDRTGALLYYRSFAPSSVGNLQRHELPGSEVLYSVCVGTSAGGWTLGAIHLMDAQLEDVGDVQLLANRSHGVLPAEAHDFLLLGDQHYIAESYVTRTVNLSSQNPAWSATATVVNAVVQEVNEGAVTMEWDSADFPSLYADSVDGNAFASTGVSDYVHLNALAIDPSDQNLVVSFRHTNSVVKIDRSTGQILWTLGGKEDQFGLTADQLFFHQHHAHFNADGSLVIFDNGNNGAGQPSHGTRVMSFVLDQTNHKVTQFQVVYAKPIDEPQTTFMGSATQLAATRYLVGWGGWTTGAIAESATEVVAGSPVWSLTFSKAGVFSYRALPVVAE